MAWTATVMVLLIVGLGVAVGSAPRARQASVPIGAGLISSATCAPQAAGCVGTGLRLVFHSSGAIISTPLTVLVTRDAGKIINVPSSETITASAWCHGRRLCWLVGGVGASSSGGSRTTGALIPYLGTELGHPHLIPGVTMLVSSVSCPATTVCWVIAAGSSGSGPWALVRFNPLTGAAHVFSLRPGTGPLAAAGIPEAGLVCTVRGACTALGTLGLTASGFQAVAVTIADGRITATAPVPGAQALRDLSCPSSGQCVAVGSGGSEASPHAVVVHLDGVQETTRTDLPGLETLTSVICRTSTTCVAAGLSSSAGAIVRINGGLARTALVRNIMGFSGLTCPGQSTCWAAGETQLTNAFKTRMVLAPLSP